MIPAETQRPFGGGAAVGGDGNGDGTNGGSAVEPRKSADPLPPERSYLDSFDKMWKRFTTAFDDMNRALVDVVAMALAPLGTLEERESVLTPAERVAVFDGRPPSLEAFAEQFRRGRYRNVVIMCGAGISTSAGIADFRSPGTGLHDQLRVALAKDRQHTEGPVAAPTTATTIDGMANEAAASRPTRVEDMFSITYFRQSDSRPFLTRVSELWPTAKGAAPRYRPTAAHRLMKALSDAGVLLRVYTQNIDGLELLAGVPVDRVVQAHGHLRTIKCTDCDYAVNVGTVEYDVLVGKLRHAVPTRCAEKSNLFTAKAKSNDTTTIATTAPLVAPACQGWLRPAVVMFGESLSPSFARAARDDVLECDALIVMGTSLVVQPFASLHDRVKVTVPRILFNRERCGTFRHVAATTESTVAPSCMALPDGGALGHLAMLSGTRHNVSKRPPMRTLPRVGARDIPSTVTSSAKAVSTASIVTAEDAIRQIPRNDQRVSDLPRGGDLPTSRGNYRDVVVLGPIDDAVLQLACLCELSTEVKRPVVFPVCSADVSAARIVAAPPYRGDDQKGCSAPQGGRSHQGPPPSRVVSSGSDANCHRSNSLSAFPSHSKPPSIEMRRRLTGVPTSAHMIAATVTSNVDGAGLPRLATRGSSRNNR